MLRIGSKRSVWFDDPESQEVIPKKMPLERNSPGMRVDFPVKSDRTRKGVPGASAFPRPREASED